MNITKNRSEMIKKMAVIGMFTALAYVCVVVCQINDGLTWKAAATSSRESCFVSAYWASLALNAYGFITVGGETYFVDTVQFTDFSVLYDTHEANIPTA